MKRLTKNAAFCCLCDTSVESKHCHDFRKCKCGNLFVDGGLDYVRRGGDPNTIIDLCEWVDDGKATP